MRQQPDLPGAAPFSVAHWTKTEPGVYWPVGVTADKFQPIWIDLRQGHVVIIGALHHALSLKIGLAALNFFYSPAQVQFFLLTPQRQETSYLVLYDTPRLRVYGNGEGVLAAVAEELARRSKTLARAGAGSFLEYNRRAAPEAGRLPFLILIADGEALDDEGACGAQLKQLVAAGWQCGLRLVAAAPSQSPAWTPENAWLVCLGAGTPAASQAALQAAGLEGVRFSMPDARGYAYVRDPDGMLIGETRRYWSTLQHLSSIARARLKFDAETP